ncbi:hypothetical protein WICMUC_005297 [Wickerhamomyces mucosus]|uniref:Karyogamy protein KAR4 n=1 Tax=Wickerhamomyces mucosus TaxID=1378264 RepID=A0A9P8PA24_9ASCO|nr:hypothetical protein WICMUC_005297 [Wickerhamomyces mucosus]
MRRTDNDFTNVHKSGIRENKSNIANVQTMKREYQQGSISSQQRQYQQHQEQQLKENWHPNISPYNRNIQASYGHRMAYPNSFLKRNKGGSARNLLKQNYYEDNTFSYNHQGSEDFTLSDVSTSSGVTLDPTQIFYNTKNDYALNQLIRKPNIQYRSTRNTNQHQKHTQEQVKSSFEKEKGWKIFKENDYSNHYIHSNFEELPVKYVRNIENPVEGYPKLQRLFQLKEYQNSKYNCTPFGARVELDNMVSTLNRWIYKENLVFDVIMIGALSENQFIYPLLTQLPLERLCSKPGFLFIWASVKKINELAGLLKSDTWAKKFRRSEELVFVPVSKDSPYYPNKENTSDEDSLFEKMQWHCWMCITGTVRRSTDCHLIHCNVDTDLRIEKKEADAVENSAVPNHIYRVTENFSSATRRLHIIPSRTGFGKPVKPRKGWVIMSPDVVVDNFDADQYKSEISRIGTNVPQDPDIESIRPKSPVQRNSQSIPLAQQIQQQERAQLLNAA